MKQFFIWAIVFAICIFLPACDVATSVSQDNSTPQPHFNICLVLDGTDRLSEQNVVPCVTSEEIVDLANTLTEKGIGSLYVSYIDNNCDNNHVAVFEWSENKPESPGDKPGYMKMVEYEKLIADSQKAMDGFKERRDEAFRDFFEDCSGIVTLVYSDAVAHQRKGSDVNGAINQASRLLQASCSGVTRSSIILVSDGCDNVGKRLSELPEGMDLFIVNSNASKHQYGELVAKEFVTLKQAAKHIFK